MPQFVEIKEHLNGERFEFHCRKLEWTGERLVSRFDIHDGGEVGTVTLPPGSISFAYYWPNHPYNVYHFVAPDGTPLAFYINLCSPPRISAERLEWRDLTVDVLIVPDERLGYRVEVLDEDELPPDLDDATRREIDAALVEVMRVWPALVRELAEHTDRLWEAQRRGSGSEA
jgi:hypothetical protein